MLRSVVESMTGAAFYVQVALILFFSVFVSVLIREFLRSRHEVERMADLPLQEDNTPAQEETR